MLSTTESSCFFSRPSSWAFLGSFQTAGSSSAALTVLRRSDLASKSKIPPEVHRPGLQVLQGGSDEVDAFCVHGPVLSSVTCDCRKYRRPGDSCVGWVRRSRPRRPKLARKSRGAGAAARNPAYAP